MTSLGIIRATFISLFCESILHGAQTRLITQACSGDDYNRDLHCLLWHRFLPPFVCLLGGLWWRLADTIPLQKQIPGAAGNDTKYYDASDDNYNVSCCYCSLPALLLCRLRIRLQWRWCERGWARHHRQHFSRPCIILSNRYRGVQRENCSNLMCSLILIPQTVRHRCKHGF